MTADSLTPRAPELGWTSVPRQRFVILASLLILFACAEALLWAGNSFARTPWWVAVIFPPFSMAAAAKCFHTMARSKGNERTAWRYFGLACASLCLGEILWGIYDVVLGINLPSPSIADIGYLACPVLFILGIWHYQLRAPFTDDTFVRVGNLGIILSATLLVYLFAYAEFLRAPIPAPLAAITVTYGILDVSAALFALIIVSLHTFGRRRRVMLLILIGLCFPAIMDFHYIRQIMGESFKVSSLFSGNIFLAMSFIFWAAFEQDQLIHRKFAYKYSSHRGALAARWEVLIPPLAVAGVILIAFANQEQLANSPMPLVFAALALFIASLAVRNWCGHRLETTLRAEALQSQSELQASNRNLRIETAARDRAQEELRQAQKMEALGQLTGGVAHDFNNLLAVIIGNLDLLEDDPSTTPSQLELLRDAVNAAERGSDLTQRLLALSRKQALRSERIEINALLGDFKAVLRRTLGERIQTQISGPSTLWPCLADRTQLENAILNLAINARDAMPDGGVLDIETSNIIIDKSYVAEHPGAKAGTYVSISVRDTGTGISGGDLKRVFEPFFTTKEVGSGTGLGLSMVYGFAKQSGGHVTIESRVKEGTQVNLILPSTKTMEQRAVVENQTRPLQGSGESILLVEDEPAVRRLVSTILTGLGYRITVAADSEEALTLLTGIESLDLLLSDVVLPGKLSGRDLAVIVEQKRPQTKILLMSGYASELVEEEGELGSAYELLRKPFRKADLARKVRSILDSHSLHTRREATRPPSDSSFGGPPPP